MTTVWNLWMICLELNWFVYDPSWILHLSKFVWALRSSVWIIFNNFFLIDATDRSKISSDQKRFFIALSLYPLTFFANTPFKILYIQCFFVVQGRKSWTWEVLMKLSLLKGWISGTTFVRFKSFLKWVKMYQTN